MSTKAERGTKRTCQNPECGSRFYDLNRDPVTCPICQTVYQIEAAPLVAARVAPAAAERARAQGAQEACVSRPNPSSPRTRRRPTPTIRSPPSRATTSRRRPKKTRPSSRPRRRTAPTCPTSSAGRWRRTTSSNRLRRASMRGRSLHCPWAGAGGRFMATCAIFRTGILKPARRQAPVSQDSRGRSSVGRAREWHSRGQRFDPARLHQDTKHQIVSSRRPAG